MTALNYVYVYDISDKFRIVIEVSGERMRYGECDLFKALTLTKFVIMSLEDEKIRSFFIYSNDLFQHVPSSVISKLSPYQRNNMTVSLPQALRTK